MNKILVLILSVFCSILLQTIDLGNSIDDLSNITTKSIENNSNDMLTKINSALIKDTVNNTKINTTFKMAENSSLNNPQDKNDKINTNTLDNALELYRQLLKGEKSIFYGETEKNIRTLITNEKNNTDITFKYALFDTNSDGLPELHIRSKSHYFIISYMDNDLVVFPELSPYSVQLNNKAFLHTRIGGAPSHVSYVYMIMDYTGNEVFRFSFEKYDGNEDNIYDKDDMYLFNNVKVSQNTWNELTKEYLSIGSDEIKWFDSSVDDKTNNLSF